jgi:hypothetical protein
MRTDRSYSFAIAGNCTLAGSDRPLREATRRYDLLGMLSRQWQYRFYFSTHYYRTPPRSNHLDLFSNVWSSVSYSSLHKSIGRIISSLK